jgi:hypothetical protein
MFGRRYPVGLLDEEKILPLGREITAVGVVNTTSDGSPVIKSCNHLPVFLYVSCTLLSPKCSTLLINGKCQYLSRLLIGICIQYVLSRALSDVNLSQTPKLGMQMISEHSIHGINCLQSCRMEQRCCSGWELLSVLLLLESFVTPLSKIGPSGNKGNKGSNRGHSRMMKQGTPCQQKRSQRIVGTSLMRIFVLFAC